MHSYPQAGEKAVQYLLRHLHPNGVFDYVYRPGKGASIEGYNLLRHAGTLYALFQWFHLHRELPLPEILEKGVSYLAGYVQPISDARYISAIVHHQEAKLGGTALALLMYTERYKLVKSAADLKRMQSLAEFLLWMQEPSGKYLSKYLNAQKEFDPFISVYYPGEAMLALLRLYQIDPDPRWLHSVTIGAGYLLRHPVMNGKVRGHNHWFAIALSELYLIQPEKAYYDEFWMITDTTIDYIPKRMQQGYSSAGMATLGEAIVAGLLLELRLGQPGRTSRLRSVIDDVLAYCLRLQAPGDDLASSGGIMQNTGKPNIRIDYVQHTLQVISGWIVASKMEAAAAPSGV